MKPSLSFAEQNELVFGQKKGFAKKGESPSFLLAFLFHLSYQTRHKLIKIHHGTLQRLPSVLMKAYSGESPLRSTYMKAKDKL